MKFIELQVRQGRGGVRALAFDTDAATVFEDHEVDLCAVVRGPVVGFVRSQRLEDFFHGVAFPRRPTLG